MFFHNLGAGLFNLILDLIHWDGKIVKLLKYTLSLNWWNFPMLGGSLTKRAKFKKIWNILNDNKS